MKKGVLRNFKKFTGKHLCHSPTTLLKKRLWHWCFSVNFEKFLRTPFLEKTSGWLHVRVVNTPLCTAINLQQNHFPILLVLTWRKVYLCKTIYQTVCNRSCVSQNNLLIFLIESYKIKLSANIFAFRKKVKYRLIESDTSEDWFQGRGHILDIKCSIGILNYVKNKTFLFFLN